MPFVRRPVLALLAALALALPAAGQERRPPDAAVLDAVTRAVVEAIRPAQARLAAAAEDAGTAMRALCAAPSPDALASGRAAFRDLVRAHGAAEMVRFGPAAEDNRQERLLFFPDRRGIALRQIQAILAREDATALDPSSLAGKSVAVQGLVALEFVLFGTDAETLETGGNFRCRYGAAAAANVEDIAKTIEDGWHETGPDGIAARLSNPSPDDPAYRGASDSLGEIVGVFVDGLELVSDLRLAPAIGAAGDEPRPNLFLFRRSGATLESLQGNLEGLSALFAAADLGALVEGEATAPGAIAFEFDKAIRAVGLVAAPVPERIADRQVREDARYLLVVVRTLRGLFEDQLSPALGLSSGFSSLDGD